MTKLKLPLLSLEATGSLGNAVSFDNRLGVPRVRKKPTPTDPHSLKQLYQRWRYQDYIAWWNALSPATKQDWETSARRARLTGFAYWMHTRLSSLDDIVAQYHMDEIVGALTHDSSPNNNPATVFGAMKCKGVIDGGLFFEGVDDYCLIANPPHSDHLTFLCYISSTAPVFSTVRTVTSDWNGSTMSWHIAGVGLTTKYRFRVDTDGGFNILDTLGQTSIREPHFLAATYDGLTLTLETSLAAKVSAIHPNPGPIKNTGNPRRIGHMHTIPFPWQGMIDHHTQLNRVLTVPQLSLQSERRYP